VVLYIDVDNVMFDSDLCLLITVGMGIVIAGVGEQDWSFVVGPGYNIDRAGKKRTTITVCNVHPSGLQGIISIVVECVVPFQWKEQPLDYVNP
jgi:hypothetical protein